MVEWSVFMLVTIDDVLRQKEKTRYWLTQQVGITYQNMKKLCDNNTSAIRFDVLERICKALECSPNDILKIDNEAYQKEKNNAIIDICLEKWQEELKYNGVINGSRV